MNYALVGAGAVGLAFARWMLTAQPQLELHVFSHAPFKNRFKDAWKTLGIGLHDYSELAISKQASCWLFAVPDDLIAPVAQHVAGTLSNSPRLAVHFSGVKAASELQPIFPVSACLSLHPVQTFGNPVSLVLSDVLFTVQGNGVESEAFQQFCKAVGIAEQQYFIIDEELKSALHLAAVFVSNFMYANVLGAKKVLDERGGGYLFEALLKPLAEKTLANVFAGSPLSKLTGPAKRGDQQTIQIHVDLLKKDDTLKELYLSSTHQLLDLLRKK